MTDKSKRRRFRVTIPIIVAILIASSLAVYLNRQFVSDALAASQYTATPQMQVIIDRVGFTSRGEMVYRATHPSLSTSTQFNELCSGVEHSESDLIIGCYTGENIHLFAIDDKRLDGIVEVTAAHELLHAVFDRLNSSEKAVLTQQLSQEFDRISRNDPKLKERMSVYDHLSPESFANELHSVLGTEVAALSPELESHYAAFLKDRARVLSLFNAYNSQFRQLEEQRAALLSELNELGRTIEAARARYEAGVAQFNSDSASLIARNGRFEFSDNPSLFYQLRDALSQQRTLLESERAELNLHIDRYNTLRSELLALDATAQDLIRSIDSNSVREPL